MNDTTTEDDGLVFTPAPGGVRRIDDALRECNGNCVSITKVHGSSDVDSHDTRCANCDSGYVCWHCQKVKVERPFGLCGPCDAAETAAAKADAEAYPEESDQEDDRAYSLAAVREVYPRAYERWDSEEDEQLVERWTDGATVYQIAAELQRNPGAIAARLAKVCSNHHRRLPEHDEVPTIYDEFGFDRPEPDPEGPTIPTVEEIENARSAAGGWNRAQLAEWGVPWPPPKGWLGRLLAEAERHHR